MKCQNCGINEVNFHYSSNVNGCVTETHLCSRCAAESGYDIGKMFALGNVFDGMFPMREMNAFVPMLVPLTRSNPMFSFTRQPLSGMIEGTGPCQYGCGHGAAVNGKPDVEVDEIMSKRRELNAQMRLAVENEEFEKAAVLRDKIKELEAGGVKQCDTETNSQDSPNAQ